jgi:hypothetical protein
MTDPEARPSVTKPLNEGLCSSVEFVLDVQTMSYINYELMVVLSGPGLGHSDMAYDVITMPLRVPQG